jgi:hypothetical protein
MTEGSEAKGDPRPFTDKARALGINVDDPDTLAWMGEHLPEWRQQASGQRPLYWILGIGFVVGLAAHVGGFLLKTSVTTEPLLLVADLLYALGWSLWTGVVVVFFVQIWPEAKRRQLKRSLDAYEAALREKARAGGDQASGTTEHRRRGSGQAERSAGWCDTSWSMTSHCGARSFHARLECTVPPAQSRPSSA